MTGFITEVEQELLDATNFKPERKYKDRQRYLEALFRACAELDDEEFDRLSDDAAEWCNTAAELSHSQRPIPDFTNGGAHEGEPTLVTGRDGVPEAPSPVQHEAQAELSGAVQVPDESQNGHAEVVDKPSRKKGKAKKAVKVTKSKEAKVPPPKPEKGKRPPGLQKWREQKGFNAFGVQLGSKCDLVSQMAARPQGVSQLEIREATGRNHYNIFRRLKKNGYDVRSENGRWYLMGKLPVQ